MPEAAGYEGACEGVAAQPTAGVARDVKERVVGVVTGVSHVSGGDYYKAINEGFQRAVGMGGGVVPRNPLMLMVSVDLSEYAALLFAEDYAGVAAYLTRGAARAVAAGAEFLVLASNTAHVAADAVQAAFPAAPLLHIADCTAQAVYDRLDAPPLTETVTVGLLGTEFTMRGEYLKARLARHGIATIIPDNDAALQEVFRAIMKELSVGVFKPETRAFFAATARALHARGACGVVLGCTEIELLLQQSDVPEVPLFPSAALHQQAIVRVVTRQADVSDYAPPEVE